MKKLLTILFIVFTINAYSQSKSFNYQNKNIDLSQKITEHFDNDQINRLKENNENLLLYLNYFSTNSYQIEDLGIKNQEYKFTHLSNLKKKKKSKAKDYIKGDLDSFNILAYVIELKEEQQVFVDDNSSKAIIVMPKKEFFKKFNSYKESLK